MPFGRAGAYAVEAEVKGLDPATATVHVHPDLSEYLDTSASSSVLEWMGQETGGRVYRPENLEELAEAIRPDPRYEPERIELPLRDSPLVLLLLIALALCEWAIRKRSGLA